MKMANYDSEETEAIIILWESCVFYSVNVASVIQ